MNSKYFLRNIIILVVAIIGVGYFLRQCVCTKPAKPTGQNPDSVFYWKNRAGDVTASLRGAKEDFAVMEQFYLDSIAKVYHTKTKFIKEFVVTTVKGTSNLPATTPGSDFDFEILPGQEECPPTIVAMRDTFANPYYSAFVQLGRDRYMKLESRDTITHVWKDVIEGRTKYRQLDISFADTSKIVTGIKSFRVLEPKQKKVGIGIQLGYGGQVQMNGLKIDGVKLGPYVGIGISYNFIRL